MNSDKNRHNFSALLLVFTIFSFGLMFLRFSQIMVRGEINGEDLDGKVERLYTRNQTLQANRGTIFDRFGNPIAIDATSYKMVAVLTDKWSTEKNPQHITDAEAVAKIISQNINLSEEKVLEYLTRDVDQIEFGSAGNNLSYQTISSIKEELEEKNLSGVIFEEKQKRLYPNGTFASHTVGLSQYTGNDKDEKTEDKQLEGVMGLEASFNDLLTGKNGKITYKKDSLGYLIPSLEHEEIDPINGNNLYLTLDYKLQTHLETILDRVQQENTPKRMTATVMDAKNGEILASAQRPSFNATTLENIDASWQNLLTEYTYEPGSTMKILTLAAAIEEGVFDPNQYYESGAIKVHGGTVRDYNRTGWGWISSLEGVARSSNVLFVRLVDAMGHDVWKEYLDAFGFGEKTGINLPNEQTGTNPYAWPLQKVNTGFGQGISVTPVQMLKAFSAIANGENIVQPRLIVKTEDNTTEEETLYEPKKLESPISKETAQLTLDYLSKAMDIENAVAKGYKKEGYSIAAKTGTAQLVDSETGAYSSSKYIYSVAALFPTEDPKYIVYITVQEPTYTEDASYGSEVVQKIYHPLIDRIIDFKEDIESDGSSENDLQYVTTPSYLDLTSSEAIEDLKKSNQQYSLIGTGEEIVQQIPYPDTPLFDDQQIILMTNGAATIPNLTNWSRNDVLKVSELTGVDITFEGEGYVVEQSLEEGSYMEPGMEITVKLSSESNGEGEASSPEANENE